MSKRNLFLLFVVAALLLVAAGIPTKSNTNGQVGLIAGRNVNMVSGTDWPEGDPWLQRQNEPSIAVSTRNPLHLLAGSNDYRSIDAYKEDELPGFEKASYASRDAWLGYYTSYDGGQSWTSTLLPGYYHADTTPPGAPPSPLLGYEAAADPVVRAGTNGLFYFSGITFNRGQRGLGQVFVARFIDNNNRETGAIEYIDTKIIDVGNAGHFIDKPWIAVDIPREGSPMTTLPNGQTVPCGNVYIVYTSFMGDLEEDAHSKMMFSMSTDCGETWSKPIQITDAGQPYQAAALAINPIDGRPYVTYRRFAKDKTDAIMLCWAERKGKKTAGGYWHGKIKFSKPMVLAEMDPFDQPTSEVTFRTNDYPTMTIDKDGIIYVAWSQRGMGPYGEGKIVMMTSADGGQTWAGLALVDDPSLSGYEFMPSLTSGAGKVMMLWYDQQYDVCGHFDDEYIQENYPIRHTIDVRAAEVHPIPDPYFSYETIQVSRYPWVFTFDDPDNPLAVQLQHNMPNLRIFGGGTVPFLGDYIDITPSPMFVPQGNGWAYNTDPASKPVFHAVWTDNRDVRPPGPGGEWWDYVAPGEGCGELDQNKTGVRNQNIYTSRITEGIIAGSPGNTKSLNIDRAFVVFVKNTTAAPRDLILEIVETSGATAYFMKAGENVGSQLLVTVLPQSSVSATVMVEPYPTNEYATVRINVLDEYEELLTYILLNPDSTNPGIEPHEGWDPGSPHVGSDGETRGVHVSPADVINWDYSVDSPHVGSEDSTSPHVGSNDDTVTPHVGSDDEIRGGSTIHVGSNNHIIMSNFVNPHVGSDDFPRAIPPNSSMTDIIWTVENIGNTTATYSLSTFPFYDYDPDQIAVQLIVYKVYTTPTALGCDLFEQEHHELILNQTSPHVGSEEPPERSSTARIASQSIPWYFDTEFSIPPKGTGENDVEYKVILRYMDKDTTDDIELDPEDQGVSAKPEAPDIIDGQVLPPVSALVIKTRAIDLDNGIVDTLYEETLEVEGGYGNYVWSLGGTASDWLSIDSTSNGFCYISGTPTTAGTYTLTVQVDDTDPDYGRSPLSQTKTLSILIAEPLEITDTSLPDGQVGQSYSVTLSAEGGIGSHTWDLASGSGPLPQSLTLGTEGIISGIPTESGTFPITVQVTDEGRPQQTATQPLTLYVAAMYSVFGTVYYSTSPLGGVDVELLDGETQAVLQTTTSSTGDDYGYYEFSSVLPGTYCLKFYGPSEEYIGWVSSSIEVIDDDFTFDRYLPKNIVLSTPSNGATVSTLNPTLTWTANPEAESGGRYTIQINDTDNWDPVIEMGNSTTNSYIVQTYLTPGENYTWQVDAYDSDNNWVGSTQSAFNFTVDPNEKLITGTLLYNGQPLTGFNPGHIDWWGLGPLPPQFNSATGQYSIPHATPGTYHIVVYVDAVRGPEGEPTKWFPGDYNGGTGDFVMTEGDYLIQKDIDCDLLMHLTSPFDNENSYGNVPGEPPPAPYGPFRTHTSTILFKSDPVPGADSYHMSIWKYFTDGNPSQFIDQATLSGNTNTEHTFILPISGANDYYYFSMNARSGGKNIAVVMTAYDNGYGGGYQFKVVPPPHIVSTPTAPSGPTSGATNTTYVFSTGGSNCSYGDSVEYQFDWGDSSQSSWLSSTNASHSWPGPGTYTVKARARCSVDNSSVSDWSQGLTVTISTYLVAYYPFNGNANDESGYGNNGTVNGATLTTDRFGNPNSAYEFDGTSDYIEVADSNSLDITNEITIAAWVKPDISNPTESQALVSKYRSEPGFRTYMLYGYTTGTQGPRFRVWTTGDIGDASTTDLLSTTDWSFVVGTYDGANAKLYINGVLKNTNSGSGLIATNSLPLRIGAGNETSHLNPFDGKIDDVRIYNRALTGPDIEALYAHGRSHDFQVDAQINIGEQALIAGDLRNDGIQRIVSGNYVHDETGNSGYIRVYSYTGGNYVEEWSTLIQPNNNSRILPVAVGDVNNDGKNEFLVNVFRMNKLQIYQWNGTTYEMILEQSIGNDYAPAAIFDIDRDGLNELVIDDKGGISVYEYLNSSLVKVWAAGNGHCNQIAIGDPDGDGKKEAVAFLPWADPGEIMVIGYDGSNYAIEATIQDFPLGGLGGGAVADFDNDGKQEMITSLFNISAAEYPIYLVKYVSGNYVVETLDNASMGMFQIHAGDIDGDGFPEASILRNSSNSFVVEYRSGSYHVLEVVHTGAGIFGDVADVDGDGKPEILSGAQGIIIVSDR